MSPPGSAARLFDFPGGFYALSRDVEQSHWSNRDAPHAKPFNIFPPVHAQRGNYACAGHHDARRWIGWLFRWKKHDQYGYFTEA